MPATREDQILRTFAEEDITVAASSTRLTLSNIYVTPPLKKVEIFVEDAQIRFRLDGSDPTSSVGEILNPFDRVTIENPSDAEAFRAIRTGGTSATIRARYKR